MTMFLLSRLLIVVLLGAQHVSSLSAVVTRRAALSGAVAVLPIAAPASEAAEPTNQIYFMDLPDGVRYADILVGTKSTAFVDKDSKVTIHITGRLLGKQGWIFINTYQEDDPFRLQLGSTGDVITGLQEGLQGMHMGGKRRIVIPSAVGYLNKFQNPIPRDFGQKQRLYTTVFNNVRKTREQAALGADLAGVVVMDVEVLRIR